MTHDPNYPGSMSDDSRESDSNPPASEIRADIDQTRAAVGEKIDQLQARLDPNRLKQQAQETVQEMITDTANSVTEYVRTHRNQMVTSLADAARRNPLPTALVGLGIGWLLLESLAGEREHEDDKRSRSERRNFSSRQSRGREQYGSEYRGQYGGQYSSQYRDPYSEQYTGSEFIDESDFNDEYVNYRPAGYPVDYESRDRDAGDNGRRHGSNPLKKAAGAVKDTLGDVTGEIKDRASDTGQEIKERMSDAGQGLKERVSEVKDRMIDQTGNVRERMGDTMESVRHQAGSQLDYWQHRARYEGRRRSRQLIHNLEDNPLTYGALAFAAGAALALLLPRTRAESRVFGEARDQLMDRSQEMIERARERAQEVVSEIRPELEEKARKLVDEVKETGKEVVQEAKEELRPVVDKAVSKTKEEARGLAQEAGVDPEKLTAGSSSGSSSTGSSSMGGTSTGSSSPTGASSSATSMGSSSTGGSSTASSSPSGTSSGSASMGRSSTGSPAMSGTVPAGSATASSSTGTKSQGDKMASNRDYLRGQWHQIKGDVKSKWGQLTDDELTRIEGDMEKLIGSLEKRYGYTRARAEQEVNEFCNIRNR